MLQIPFFLSLLLSILFISYTFPIHFRACTLLFFSLLLSQIFLSYTKTNGRNMQTALIGVRISREAQNQDLFWTTWLQEAILTEMHSVFMDDGSHFIQRYMKEVFSFYYSVMCVYIGSNIAQVNWDSIRKLFFFLY